MSTYEIGVCDLCDREVEPYKLNSIVINHFHTKQYEKREQEHFCVEIDLCHVCIQKYKLCDYKRKDEAINFIKEQHGFLSGLWKVVNGRKENREDNS